MRICCLIDAKNIHGRRWIEPLVERGHQVYVVSNRGIEATIPGVVASTDLTALFNVRRIRPLVWGLWLRRYVDRIRPDILHAHELPAGGWIAAMANYHPLVLSAWGSDLLRTPQSSRFWHLLISRALAHYDRVTVPSTIMYDAALTLGFPESRLQLIPWGLESTVYNPNGNHGARTRARFGLPEDAQVVLCPRAVKPIYNQDTLVAAFKRLLFEHPNAYLALIQYNVDVTYLTELKTTIRKQGLSSRVVWIQAQETMEQMAELYRTADLMVSIPSSEGYGFSVYEAMACGTPTTISDLPIFSENIEHQVHTLKVPVRSVEHTVEAMKRLLVDSHLRDRLVQNGLQLTRSMSVTNRVKLLEQVYEDLLAEYH